MVSFDLSRFACIVTIAAVDLFKRLGPAAD
jgi:hypothetical protein